MLLALAVIIAIPFGYFYGGRLRNYIHAPLKLVMLPCFAFLFEAFFPRMAEAIPCPVSCWQSSSG